MANMRVHYHRSQRTCYPSSSEFTLVAGGDPCLVIIMCVNKKMVLGVQSEKKPVLLLHASGCWTVTNYVHS